MTPRRSIGASKDWKGERLDGPLLRQAGGVEAEFTLIVDDRPARPEDVFGSPRGFITEPLMHRTGRSFHLPNGCAIYFDTGVIEIASPVMELAAGCFGRLARSLDDAIRYVRGHLDAWERRTGRRVRLQGFSAHYNVSISEGPRASQTRNRELAWLLAHLLPAPVMLLGTNRRSTGVGVRPRPHRIEVTADFPPDLTRMAATGTCIAGIVSAVSTWPDLAPAQLPSRGIPLLQPFWPRPHTSRRGWVARPDSFPHNPFVSSPDACRLPTTSGALSVRALAQTVFTAFADSIARVADPCSYRLLRRLLSGELPTWLDEPDRPASYDDVGRQRPIALALRALHPSAYERVVLNAIRRKPLQLDGQWWTPVGVRGWSRIVLRRDRDGMRVARSLDTLLPHLDRW